ncbi:DNA polymerase III subunit beta [Desulfolucanica intricata]|uniref:DNA polymerase III subunit beta n=1 Tax=Desulfolucanica intricata TaxID=1285191 RepID=UPI00082DD569|nr:DNA polymerase III subunit beta [Desulfolucanica intricata]
MNFISTKNNLLYAIQTVQRAVSPKNPLPILSGILFKASGNSLTLQATDLEMGIECSVPVKVIKEGHIVLPARYIIDIIRKLPDCDIDFNSNDLINSVTIKYLNSQANIHGFSAEEFPIIPNTDTGQTILFENNFLKQILKQVIFATGTDENRPIFNGVLFEFNENNLTLVATDTHRLATISVQSETLSNEIFSVIVPAKTLSELIKITSNQDDQLKITITENQIFFIMNDIKITSRLINGRFPNYKQVIPQSYISVINLNLKEILEAVERASSLNDSNSQLIKLDCAYNNYIVVSTSNEAGQIYEEIPAVVEGEPIQIFFNSRYLIDALKAVNTENIYLNLSGPVSPCVLRTDETNYLSLLLPVRP